MTREDFNQLKEWLRSNPDGKVTVRDEPPTFVGITIGFENPDMSGGFWIPFTFADPPPVDPDIPVDPPADPPTDPQGDDSGE